MKAVVKMLGFACIGLALVMSVWIFFSIWAFGYFWGVESNPHILAFEFMLVCFGALYFLVLVRENLK